MSGRRRVCQRRPDNRFYACAEARGLLATIRSPRPFGNNKKKGTPDATLTFGPCSPARGPVLAGVKRYPPAGGQDTGPPRVECDERRVGDTLGNPGCNTGGRAARCPLAWGPRPCIPLPIRAHSNDACNTPTPPKTLVRICFAAPGAAHVAHRLPGAAPGISHAPRASSPRPRISGCRCSCFWQRVGADSGVLHAGRRGDGRFSLLFQGGSELPRDLFACFCAATQAFAGARSGRANDRVGAGSGPAFQRPSLIEKHPTTVTGARCMVRTPPPARKGAHCTHALRGRAGCISPKLIARSNCRRIKEDSLGRGTLGETAADAHRTRTGRAPD
eukprot:gene8482-biopygen4634